MKAAGSGQVLIVLMLIEDAAQMDGVKGIAVLWFGPADSKIYFFDPAFDFASYSGSWKSQSCAAAEYV